MKQSIILVTLLFFSNLTFAQVPKERARNRGQMGMQHNEKIEAMKVGFITEKLALSTDEAQVFWPIYNEFHDKKRALKRSWRQFESGEVQLDELPDEQLEEVLALRMENNIKEAQLEKEYHQKFVKALGIQKTAKLYKAEVEFKRGLLRNLKEKP